jgi:predicted metal-dependent hydrolase
VQRGDNFVERAHATVVAHDRATHAQQELSAGTLFNLREWAALWSFLFVTPGGMRDVIALYFTYYRPGFHPWDVDNRDLLEAWKQSALPPSRQDRREWQ